jgi:hypothetical protein
MEVQTRCTRSGIFIGTLLGTRAAPVEPAKPVSTSFFASGPTLNRAGESPVDDDIGQFGKDQQARSPVISVCAPQFSVSKKK